MSAKAMEALRAEVEDYRENGAAAVRFAPGSAHWSNELRRLFGDDARKGIDILELRLRDAQSEIERLRAERDALALDAARMRELLALIDAQKETNND